PNVGAVVQGDTLVAIGGPFSELEAGGPTFDALGLDEFYSTTNPEDIGNFPDVCTVDDFRLQQFPSLQPFTGEPFPGFADQTVCIAGNDIQAGTCGDCGGTRLGVEIVSTLFAFGVPLVQDFVFVGFRIFNSSEFVTAANTPAVAAGTQVAGPYDFEGTVVSIGVDPDIGDAGDDQVAFLPEVQTMVFWDSDFTEPQFQGTPGFGGISYLKTPIDPTTGEEVGLAEFTVFTNGNPRPDPNSKEEWYRAMTGDLSFVVLEVSPRDVRGLASSGKFPLPADEFVEIYAAYFFAPVAGAPPGQLLAEAYKNLTTGVVNPNANQDPAFDTFKTVQLTAQATFDAGFVVPTSPPKPDFTLIPGDMQVTIVWEADPVEFVNPFAKVARDPFARLPSGQPDPEAPPITDADGNPITLDADQVIYVASQDVGGTTGFITAGEAGLTGAEVTNAAFDPDFMIQDFQGFRVYRSRTGLLSDAELIAQFDLADAVVGGLFCFDAEPVFFEDEFVTAVCTDVQEAAIGTNTGLSFAVVDRGGTFPNPADGPGLINGIPVFYTVTSYAVNLGSFVPALPDAQLAALPAATPAAPLILESGLAPLREVTPRSNASSFDPAIAVFIPQTEAGEDCDPDEPTATVDPATGEYVDFRDCSNAIAEVALVPARDANLPTGDFFLVVDSLTNPAVFPYQIAAGGNRVWFHWERADGSPATEIQPTVGFFDQVMNFAFSGSTKVFFGFDTDPSDTGVDLGINTTFVVDASVIEDLEVNGQSLHLEELGGTHVSEHRPHRIDGSSLADVVVIGNARDGGGGSSREYSQPFPYAQGGTSYELTWSVSGGTYTGTLRQLPGGNVIPEGGQPKGPDNPSTPADFVAGWNWGFIAPDTPATVQARIMPANPLTNTIMLDVGDTFVVFVPGQSVYIEGIQDLPEDGEVWTFLIDSGFQRAAFGREGGDAGDPPDPNLPVGPFSYSDLNTESAQGHAYPTDVGITNVYPGMTWKLSVSGGSNELADADLSQIAVVPNPFIAANEITRGRGIQRLLFTNLPPQATIRIYTISGNLVRVLEHSDGSGTEPWDVRTRFDLLVASGNYYYHVTTPDGRTHLGRFAVIN
ncbi:MAG: T9SS type A sorting domain-containing protein, partial [Gemmatimonadetes bacterium]|nr:T9SS type A sorting domain-containing protein [Gemmatimonadota bacterium]